jgi:Mg-chelatase subunit ChlD
MIQARRGAMNGKTCWALVLLLGATLACVGQSTEGSGEDAGFGGSGDDAGLGGSGDDVGSGGPSDGSAGDAGDASVAPDASDASAGGDDGGSGFDVGIAACATSSKKAELTPLDLMIVQDTSYSMDFDWKWVSVKAALRAFVTNSAFDGMGVALTYFPARAQCRLTEYGTPAVPMGRLPSVTGDFVESLEKQSMFGGTPMVQVLEGTYDYAKKWARENPERKLVVLLATDGIPDSTCAVMSDGTPGNSLENVIAVTSTAATTAPRIPTFVIGVGSELGALDQIAQAGGTGKAFAVDTNHDTEAAFLKALNDIRGNALTCDLPIPLPDRNAADLSQVAVVFKPEDGAPQLFTRVADAVGCQSAPETGWHFDDPTSPTRIVLCEEVCRTVTSKTSGHLEIVVGCMTVPN